MKCRKLRNSMKHKNQNIIKLTKIIPPAKSTQLYSALKNTITKGAAYLLFFGASAMKEQKYRGHFMINTRKGCLDEYKN